MVEQLYKRFDVVTRCEQLLPGRFSRKKIQSFQHFEPKIDIEQMLYSTVLKKFDAKSRVFICSLLQYMYFFAQSMPVSQQILTLSSLLY